jgi:hypothetical protein
MNNADLLTVLRALPWHEREARKIIAKELDAYLLNDPYVEDDWLEW